MSNIMIPFMRIEPTLAAVQEGIGKFASSWNKRIVIYITNGKKVAKVHEESYTEAKEKLFKAKFISLPEKAFEIPYIVKQDISKIKLTRIV